MVEMHLSLEKMRLPTESFVFRTKRVSNNSWNKLLGLCFLLSLVLLRKVGVLKLNARFDNPNVLAFLLENGG